MISLVPAEAVALQVWYLDQQTQHHLTANQKRRLSGLTCEPLSEDLHFN